MAPGGDRASLRLSAADESLIAAAAAENDNVVVVVVGGSAVVMPWASTVPAILMTWYSGVEGGSALADVFHSHEEILRDASLLEQVRAELENERINAEVALQRIFWRWERSFSNMEVFTRIGN